MVTRYEGSQPPRFPKALPGYHDDNWLTTAEVAALLRVHYKHVYRLRNQGMPAKRVGGQWRFSREAILQWSEQRARLGSTAAASDAPCPPTVVAYTPSEVTSAIVLALTNASSERIQTTTASRVAAIDALVCGSVSACLVDALEPEPPRLPFACLCIHMGSRKIGWISADKADTKALDPRAPVAVTDELLALISPLLTDRLPEHLVRVADCLAACGLVLRFHAQAAFGPQPLARQLGLRFSPVGIQHWCLLVRADSMSQPSIARLCLAAQRPAVHEQLASLLPHERKRAGQMGLCPGPDSAASALHAAVGDSEIALPNSAAPEAVCRSHWTLLQRRGPDQMLELVRALRRHGLCVGGFLQMPSGPALRKPLGYDLYRLSRPERVALAERQSLGPLDRVWCSTVNKGARRGVHCELTFHGEAIERATQWLQQDMASADLVIVDGIGSLERHGKGFFPALAWARSRARGPVMVLASGRPGMQQLASRLELSEHTLASLSLGSDLHAPASVIDHLVGRCHAGNGARGRRRTARPVAGSETGLDAGTVGKEVR